ncbi:MAG TPA: HD domain-containing protein [Allosphingosinicella sp.]
MRLEAAIAFASECHTGQTDKGGHPYILHPLRVMLKLDDEERRIAALLHDTVEDCGVPLSVIRERFGDPVAEAVDALTKRPGETYEQFIERCGLNDIARAVKLADISDNSDLSRLKQVTTADLARIEKYRAAAARLADIGCQQSRRHADSSPQAQAGPQRGGK